MSKNVRAELIIFYALHFLCCQFKSSEECLWAAILNRPLPSLSDLVLLLGDMGRGFEQRVLRLFGNKVLHVAPRHVLPVRQLILCNPHHACGTEKETETDIISRMVPKSEEIEWKLLQ